MATAGKIAFLDRDGTLILEPADEQVDRLDKIALVPGVIPALLRLRDAGYEFAMVTNQDGLGTASFPEADFRRVQDFVLELFRSQGIEFHHVFICPHRPADRLRVPQTESRHPRRCLPEPDFDRERSFVAGDRDTDLEFARNIGVPGYRVDPADAGLLGTHRARDTRPAAHRERGTRDARNTHSASQSIWTPSSQFPYTPASAFSITCSSRSPSMAASP